MVDGIGRPLANVSLVALLCAGLICCGACSSPPAATAPKDKPPTEPAPTELEAPVAKLPEFCPEGTQELKRARYRWCKQGEQLQGPFHVSDESGQVVLQGQFDDNKLAGEWTSYWSAQKPRWRVSYVDNQEQGLVEGWYASGEKRMALTYSEGKLNGEASYWDEQGHLIAKTQYKSGKPTGTWSYWHPNGQKSHELTWKANGKEGIHYHWTPEGKKTISPNGRLAKSKIEPPLAPLGQDVLDCYRHARLIDPSSGKIVAQFAIDYSGDVSMVSILESDFKHPFLGKCARRYVEGLRFVENPYGRTTIIRSWELSVN